MKKPNPLLGMFLVLLMLAIFTGASYFFISGAAWTFAGWLIKSDVAISAVVGTLLTLAVLFAAAKRGARL